VEISHGAIIKCSYEFCVKVVIKFKLQSKTPSRVTPSRDSIITPENMRMRFPIHIINTDGYVTNVQIGTLTESDGRDNAFIHKQIREMDGR
jgi:hypothetical protein